MQIGKTRLNKGYLFFFMSFLLLFSVISITYAQILGTKVNLKIKGKDKEVVTYATTVKDFIKQEKIILDKNQAVSPSLDTEIVDGMTISISGLASYTVIDEKGKHLLESSGSTVEEVLENSEIKLGNEDYTRPARSEEIEAGQEIEIFRIKHTETTIEQEESFDVVEKINENLKKDQRRVIQKGKTGIITEKVRNTYANGELITQEILDTKVTRKPVTEIVEVGNSEAVKEVVQASDNSFDPTTAKKVFTMEATAYDPSAGSKTAMGTRARVGAVAVDPKVIPLGSKLYIETTDGWPSYGYAVAEDTGGAIKGKKIDLFFNSKSTALKFGRRLVKVYVIE
ncbi:G5 domain-containing protein [Peptoniphilus sp. GNH]|nr:G5 domain-containing protein [Peptoniphilus sp. GNH]